MRNKIVVVRGGGDIATGVIQKLVRSGFKVLVLECSTPKAIRRTVSLCEAVYDGLAIVEDLKAIHVTNLDEIKETWNNGEIPIVVDEVGSFIKNLKPDIVVDAILAKKNLGTNKSMAPITIALGPGFHASVDVDIVIETMRGHDLGRLIYNGYTKKNTGVPGEIGGYAKERVIHSPSSGIIYNLKNIGDIVSSGETIALVDDIEVKTTISGVLRGLIRNQFHVFKGLKIADVDPRLTEIENYQTISDKARNIGGAVLEAILYKMKEKQQEVKDGEQIIT